MATKKTILMLVGPEYEDLEVWYPKLRLEEAGYPVVLAGMGEQAGVNGRTFGCGRVAKDSSGVGGGEGEGAQKDAPRGAGGRPGREGGSRHPQTPPPPRRPHRHRHSTRAPPGAPTRARSSPH